MAEPKQRFNEAERIAAVASVVRLIEEEGYSQGKACEAIADELGLNSKRTIGMWAIDQGTPLPSGANARARLEKAAQAKVIYNQIERQNLSDSLFRKIAELLAKTHVARDLKELSVAYAVLVEKRRLEEGKSTGRQAFDIPSQSSDPNTLEELATGVAPQRALPGNVSPLSRRPAYPINGTNGTGS